MAVALGKLKLSLSDFWELTPVELQKIHERFEKDRMELVELQQRAVYLGFGQANSGKKFKSMFKKEKKQAQPRIVSDEQKQKELKEIQDRLKGVNQ